MNTQILLIEADIRRAQFLVSNLSEFSEPGLGGHTCFTVARSGVQGLLYARELQFDLILLGMGLPDFSGLEICRRLRSTGNRAQIMVLGARHGIQDCVAGLDAGANDYLFPQISMEELKARMRSRLRRARLETQCNRLHFENLTLDRLTHDVYRHRHAIALTAREFSLLEYFMAHPRRVMTRDQILEQVWTKNPDIESNVLDVYIRYLRVKLEQHQMPRLIHTVRGVGYVLREPTRRQASPVCLVQPAAHPAFSAAS
ncbi:response regulator transcription factor [Nodosilinea nodulosa]|uniref:response regulator transcription factor n=1 Tax=Nodosilinea nodulosa TaxID=416001 RepID=UPI0002D3D05D|nr:response regulator transcription factor [Nodosilinea nodulosa]